MAVVLVVCCTVLSAAAGAVAAARLAVPAVVRLPRTDDTLTEFGFRVRHGEDLQRNSRQTVSVARSAQTDGPLVSLRYYPPRTDGLSLAQRLEANRGAGPRGWFAHTCDLRAAAGAGSGEPAPADAFVVGDAAPVDLRFGDIVETPLGVEVDYVKACAGRPELDRHGRLLMIAAPGGAGDAIMLDADLEGQGGAGAEDEDGDVLRDDLHDVAERVRRVG